ncbi:DeoR/GlpR family DNA-binding transcription regulator [Actinoplanes bogorensis]|uniref:Lactose phosphotransferase system repressor n=1 Tax=Paractinoplanes bogorensis TaxID=1610840 RepID=A0ABS5YZL6_9ACTN|nr:DeoR/GlpR family DNA-binding transcription regulator [Actinoplanes bogorensis]MBU2668887.1 DeoR/GlpR family DNA-binding transcription regulator [Actinoplanes bogorensis]
MVAGPSNAPQFGLERRRRLIEVLRENGRLEVSSLAEEFAVTSETIRRDLINLEREGLVHRVHGGAILTERGHFVPGLPVRDRLMSDEKDAIAHVALQYMPPEGAVLIDAGSTTGRLAEVFAGGLPLTVLTNGLQVATSLAAKPGLTVHTLGGRVRGNTLAEVDAAALRSLSRVHADVAFVGTYGVSVRHGFSTPDPAEAAVKEAMIAAAQTTVILCDHTKIGREHFARFAEITTPAVLITDSGAPGSLVRGIEAAGLEVVLAEAPQS